MRAERKCGRAGRGGGGQKVRVQRKR